MIENAKLEIGNPLYIALEFFEWVRQFDVSNKIILYEDTFTSWKYIAQNDTRERNLLAQTMGKGGWHIQIDVTNILKSLKVYIF
jgi:hypothetical protein